MTFHNATHLTYEYIASANSSVIDSATLYKKHDFGTPKPKTRKPPGLRGGPKEKTVMRRVGMNGFEVLVRPTSQQRSYGES